MQHFDLFSLLALPGDSPQPTISAEDLQNELNLFAEGQFTFDVPPPMDDSSSDKPSVAQLLPLPQPPSSTFELVSIPNPVPVVPATVSSSSTRKSTSKGRNQKRTETHPPSPSSLQSQPSPKQQLLPRWESMPQIVQTIPTCPPTNQHQQLQSQSQNMLTAPFPLQPPVTSQYTVVFPQIQSNNQLPNPVIKSRVQTPHVQITPTVPAPASISSRRTPNTATTDDEKRKRNTAASARFRLRKKAKQEALEANARELQQKTEYLANRVKSLEIELNWLRGLLVGRDGPEKVHQLTEMFNKNRDMVMGIMNGISTKSCH